MVFSLWFLYDPELAVFISELFLHNDQVHIGSFIRDFGGLCLGVDDDELPYDHLSYTFRAALVCYGAPTGILLVKKKKKQKQAWVYKNYY